VSAYTQNYLTQSQGDQIGRIFDDRVIVYIGHFLKIKQFFGLLFSTVKAMYVLILQKFGRATFWAILSQTHPVTLLRVRKNNYHLNEKGTHLDWIYESPFRP
jgi:hypothetical protein